MGETTLNLVLTFHWYDETVLGDKRVEYRAMTPHWKKLIWDRRKDITHVRFQRAYTKGAPTATYKVNKIDAGPCLIDGWDDQYYRIYFEEVG